MSIPLDINIVEIATNIHYIPNFLSKEQCSKIIEDAESFGNWESAKNDNYPGQEIRTNLLTDYTQNIVIDIYKYIAEQTKIIWPPTELFGLRDSFLIKYSVEGQKNLPLHNDHSLVSGSIKLNNEYVGGALWFPRQNFLNSVCNTGDLIFWPAQVTHPHECLDLLFGVKYSLTIWTKRSPWD